MSVVRSFCSRLALPRLLSVTPESSMVDSKWNIKATGFEANSGVTIRSMLKHKARNGLVTFEAHAHYIADDSGSVLVADQSSFGGTYHGTDPMGLLWSMGPSPGQRLGTRFVTKDITQPMVVQLSVYHGHLDTEALQTAEPEATTTADRRYMGGNVERIPVRSGRLRGTLFKPKGPGPFPGVIDMYGSSGGLLEVRAALLASHGLACYALPFFNYDDLPANMWNLELEYFKEAIDWLADRPFVKPEGIAMVGISVGGQNALATVSHFPEKVKAVVSINGVHLYNIFPMTLKGEPFPFVGFDAGGLQPSETTKGAYDSFDCYKASYEVKEEEETVFKLENAPNCQFLFIVGDSDRLWDSCHFAQEATKRLARHGCHNYQLLKYSNAGHLIEPPYAPVTDVSFSSFLGSVFVHGGTVKATAAANKDSWGKIVSFLHAHCGSDNSKL